MTRSRFLQVVSNPLFLIIAFALMALLRMIYLDSDPSFLMQRDFITDEGSWILNARNAVLFGKWTMDDFNASLYITPLFCIFEYFAFRIFGVSLFSARLVSAITGSLTMIIFYSLLRRVWDKEKSALATLFLGFSHVHIMYSRVALAEATLIMFLILALYLWLKGSDSRIWCFFSGLCFGMTFLTKITAFYFIPIFLILWVTEYIRKEFALSKFINFAAGILVVGIPHLVLFVIPNWKQWWYMVSAGNISTITFFDLWKFPTNSNFILTPILSSIMLLYLFYLIPRLIKNLKNTIKEIDYLEVLSISVFIGNAALLVFSSYQPERRYLPFIVPLAIIGSKVLTNPGDYMGIQRLNSIRGIALLMIVLTPLWVYIGYVLLVIGRISLIDVLRFPPIYLDNICKLMLTFFSTNIKNKPEIVLLLISILTLIILFGIFWKTMRTKFMRPLLQNIISSGIVLFFLFQSLQYATWLINPTYTIKEASKEISNYVGTETIALRASTILIGTRAYLVVPWVEGINADVITKYKPGFALTTSMDSGRNYDENFIDPREQQEKIPIGSKRIKKFYLCPVIGSDYRFIFCLWQLPKNS